MTKSESFLMWAKVAAFIVSYGLIVWLCLVLSQENQQLIIDKQICELRGKP